MSCLSPKKGFRFVSMFVGSRVRQLLMWIGRQIKADSLLDDWIILLTLTIFKSTLEGVVCELSCWANLSLGLVPTSPIQQAFYHFPAPRLIGFVLVQIFQTGKSWTIAVNPLAVVTSDPMISPINCINLRFEDRIPLAGTKMTCEAFIQPGEAILQGFQIV